MKFKDQLRFIRRNMKKNRLRVFMTILSTMIGCTFLIVLASVGFGLQKSTEESILSQTIITEIAVKGQKNGKEVDVDELSEFKGNDNIAAIIERTTLFEPIQIKLNDLKGDFNLTFTNMEEEKKKSMKLEEGRMPDAVNEIVVGYGFASQLWTEKERQNYNKQLENAKEPTDIKEPEGYKGNIIGKTVEFKIPKTGKEKKEKTIKLTIVGVKEKPKQDGMSDTDVLINDKLKKDFENILIDANKNKDINKELNVYANKFENVEQVTKDLQDSGFYVRSVTTMVDDISVFFNAFKIGLIFVGTVAVIIASIGIFNTMTMAVTERTQEIGIMKAIGATPSIIRKMFLLESLYIGTLGSIIGVITSYGISFGVNLIVPQILSSVEKGATMGSMEMTFSYIPFNLVITAMIICVGVAAISGINPAIKATRTDVLSALRREI
ncbi:ABC transporter permease [Bacillus sp. NSP9.1]|uniref:ABC transporter permease n=1 Tax=Bacillus sp. NSP9.1 TaxID=1071078 RepID=UPI00047E119B|nr:FtsX-like permease family protein [Bacillus sp. NSP9.1]QHZ48135.1 ABC transporter permease [Bacillus sp. NSP9.1]